MIKCRLEASRDFYDFLKYNVNEIIIRIKYKDKTYKIVNKIPISFPIYFNSSCGEFSLVMKELGIDVSVSSEDLIMNAVNLQIKDNIIKYLINRRGEIFDKENFDYKLDSFYNFVFEIKRIKSNQSKPNLFKRILKKLGLIIKLLINTIN